MHRSRRRKAVDRSHNETTYLRARPLSGYEFSSLKGANNERVWEAYAQNKTPGAYRVFFHYGPGEKKGPRRIAVLTIVAITPHP